MTTLLLDPDLDEDLIPEKTRWKKGVWRMPTKHELDQALCPTVANRVLSFVGWHTPELVSGAALATGGGVLWGPAAWLGVLPAAVTATRHGVTRLRTRRQAILAARPCREVEPAAAGGEGIESRSGSLEWPADDPDRDATVTHLHRGSA